MNVLDLVWWPLRPFLYQSYVHNPRRDIPAKNIEGRLATQSTQQQEKAAIDGISHRRAVRHTETPQLLHRRGYITTNLRGDRGRDIYVVRRVLAERPSGRGHTAGGALALSHDGTIGGFSGGSELQVAFAVYRGESGRFGRLCEGKTGAPAGCIVENGGRRVRRDGGCFFGGRPLVI